MIKQMDIFHRKPGMTREAFIEHYETSHAPLIVETLPVFEDYRRSFTLPGASLALGGTRGTPHDPAFDVIIEVWFENQAKIDKIGRILADPEKARRLSDDEGQFIDRQRMTIFFVDECISLPAGRRTRPAGLRGGPPIKIVSLQKAKEGVARDEFIKQYERYAAVTSSLFPMCADYRRSYPIPGSTDDASQLSSHALTPEFDVLTEMWFWDEADFHAFETACKRPDVRSRLGDTEDSLLDLSRLVTFQVEERITPPEKLRETAAQVEKDLAARTDD
jgi:hypothetical protein